MTLTYFTDFSGTYQNFRFLGFSKPDRSMNRLNSGNVGILYPNEFHSNLDSWVKSALKIFQSDINIAHENVIIVLKIDFLSFAWAITNFELIELNCNFRSLKFNLFMLL